MLTWGEWEKGGESAEAKKLVADHDCIKCAKCKCTYFEEVRATQYLIQHSVIIGQPVPPKPSEIPFILYRCIKCKELTEPRLLRTARDNANKKYDAFLIELESETVIS